MPEIGDQLRETRMRNRIDITEVEAATKIRAKYLRALENEEWDLLPGPTFVKTFLRTYADYLGLDARNLVEEYRSRYERSAGPELTPFGPNRGSRRARPPRRFALTPWLLIGLGLILLVGALFVIGSWGDDNDPGDEVSATPTPEASAAPGGDGQKKKKEKQKKEQAAPTVVRLQIQPTGPVSVCVEDASGDPRDQQRHARRQPGHRDVPLQALHDVVRHRRGGDARRRQGLPGVRRRARGLLGQGGWRAAQGVGAPDLRMSVRAGIVVTGTEVLSAIIPDRNGPWLSERLRERGVELAHIVVVADRPDDVRAALEFLAGEGVDLILTTGGLGPTADDLTAEVVGAFAGLEMVLDPALEERILAILRRNRARWRSYSEEAMRAGNRKQAVIPRGATILEPVGTAPGLVVEGEGRPLVVVLPGPPGELRPMWAVAVTTPPLQRAAGPRGHARVADAPPLRRAGGGDRAVAARDRGGRGGARPARDHDLPAPRRDRDRHRLRPRRRARVRRVRRRDPRAPRRHAVLRGRRRPSTRSSPGCSAGARSRSPSRAPAG